MNPCAYCEKSFAVKDELMYHVTLEHKGMSAETLQHATDSLVTKKQLGYSGFDLIKKGVECPDCYNWFPSPEILQSHRKKIHNTMMTPEAVLKMKEIEDIETPTCEKCNRKYLTLIICRMEGKPIGSCLNCYEKHYGQNALTKITIGTPDDMIAKMRKPIE